MLISFFVHGEPQPAGSKRAFIVKRKDGKLRAAVTDDNPRSKPWQAMVADAAREAYSGSLLDGPLRLSLTFFRVRPASHFGSGRNAGALKASAPAFPTTKPDTTKLVRGVEDALSLVIWRDDARIVEQHAVKVWGERPGVHVEIETIGANNFNLF